MDSRWLVVVISHGVATALALKAFGFLLPDGVVSYYTDVANLLLCLFVAKATLPLSKTRFLNDRVQPENKAVLITGCDTGFGHQLAKRLDAKGFHVFASCLDPTSDGADSLRTSCSKRLQVFGLDVTKDEKIEEALTFVKENLGTSEFWAVVNNAGVVRGFTSELTSLEDYRQTFEVNTFGMVRVTKAFLPLLRQSKGRVINLTSLAGRLSFAHFTAYTMSKAAAVAFTECLKQEMDVWGVKAITVEPELFNTPLISGPGLARIYDRSLLSVPDSVKADYGDQYHKKFKSLLQLTTSYGTSKIHYVVDALEAAVSLQHPDAVYQPRRSPVAGFGIYLLQICPAVVTDLVYKVFWSVTGCPTPKEAEETL